MEPSVHPSIFLFSSFRSSKGRRKKDELQSYSISEPSKSALNSANLVLEQHRREQQTNPDNKAFPDRSSEPKAAKRSKFFPGRVAGRGQAVGNELAHCTHS